MQSWSETFLTSGALSSVLEKTTTRGIGAGTMRRTTTAATATATANHEADDERMADERYRDGIAGAELFLRLLARSDFGEELTRVVRRRYPSADRTALDEALVAAVMMAPEHAEEIMLPICKLTHEGRGDKGADGWIPADGEDEDGANSKRRKVCAGATTSTGAETTGNCIGSLTYSADAPPFYAFISLFTSDRGRRSRVDPTDGRAGFSGAAQDAARTAVLRALDSANASSTACCGWMADCLAAASQRVVVHHFRSVVAEALQRSTDWSPETRLRLLHETVRRIVAQCAMELARDPNSTRVLGAAMPAVTGAIASVLANASAQKRAEAAVRQQVREMMEMMAAPFVRSFNTCNDTEWIDEVVDALLGLPEDEDEEGSGRFSLMAIMRLIEEQSHPPAERLDRVTRVVDVLLRRCRRCFQQPPTPSTSAPTCGSGHPAVSARRMVVRILGGIIGDLLADGVDGSTLEPSAQFLRWLAAKVVGDQEAICLMLLEAWGAQSNGGARQACERARVIIDMLTEVGDGDGDGHLSRRLSEVFLRVCESLGRERIADGDDAFYRIFQGLLSSETITCASKVELILELQTRLPRADQIAACVGSAVKGGLAQLAKDSAGQHADVNDRAWRSLVMMMELLEKGGNERCRMILRHVANAVTLEHADSVIQNSRATEHIRVLCSALRFFLSSYLSALAGPRAEGMHLSGTAVVSHAAAMDVAVAAGTRAIECAYSAVVRSGGVEVGVMSQEDMSVPKAAALFAFGVLLKEELVEKTIASMVELVSDGTRASHTLSEDRARRLELCKLICVHSPRAVSYAVALMRTSLWNGKLGCREGRSLVLDVLTHILRTVGFRELPVEFATCAEAVMEPLCGHYAEPLHADGELDLLSYFKFLHLLTSCISGNADAGSEEEEDEDSGAHDSIRAPIVALISAVGPRIVMLLCDSKTAGVKLTYNVRSAGIGVLASALANDGTLRRIVLDAFTSRFTSIRAAGSDLGCSLAVARGLHIDVADLE